VTIAKRNFTAYLTIEIAVPHVALVTIDRPDSRNAIDAEVTEGMRQALYETENSPQIWASVLTGSGNHAFCAGADLKEVAAGKIDALNTLTGGFAAFVHAQRSKPWSAAVNGAAVAGGAYRLIRTLPRQLALELIVTGATIDAAKLETYGVVNRLTERGEAVGEAINLAVQICNSAPLAVRESLAIAKRALDRSDAELSKLSLEAQDRLKMTEDFREGPLAFLEKRPARWKGC
jgi:enoyl-CoA hydratase/carnithine racemase